jgi:hypothetical protein
MGLYYQDLYRKKKLIVIDHYLLFLACPAGVSKVKCPQALCRFSQCPNAPDALCRIDSCGQCNVEYYNKTTWEKITCTNDGN